MFSQQTHQPSVMAIILAGGQGTRMHPLTRNRCKPAVAFGGRYRLIDIPISNALNSGIRNIAVISQYFAADLNEHVYSTYRLDHFQPVEFKLLSPEENSMGKVWFKGTADAIRQNLDHLLATPAEFFLILSGDQLYNADLRPLLDFAREKNADLVISSLAVPEQEARRMGLLKIDNTQKITDFHEKPSDPTILKKFQMPPCLKNISLTALHYLGSMGIYVFKRSALVSILQEEGDDFGHGIIPQQVKRGNSYAFLFDGYWEDIGTISAFYKANLALTDRKDCLDTSNEQQPIYAHGCDLPSAFVKGTRITRSILAQGCIIEADEITHSIIGIRSKIGAGTLIRDSIIFGKHNEIRQCMGRELLSTIGAGCIIEKTIIDEDTHIGDHVTLVNKNQVQEYDGDGVFIRDGIIIVTSGTSLPDGFTL